MPHARCARALPGSAAAITGGGGAAEAASIDITNVAQTDAVLAGIKATHGRLDGLVCTPSINVRKALLNYSEEEFDRVVFTIPVGEVSAPVKTQFGWHLLEVTSRTD